MKSVSVLVSKILIQTRNENQNHYPQSQQKYSHSLSAKTIKPKIRAKISNTMESLELTESQEMNFKQMLEYQWTENILYISTQGKGKLAPDQLTSVEKFSYTPQWQLSSLRWKLHRKSNTVRLYAFVSLEVR